VSLRSIFIIEIIGLFLISWILYLTRTKKLYVGFSVIWFLTVTALMTVAASPSVLRLISNILGITVPASFVALLCYIFIFILIVLINLSKQVSILANNVTKIAQFIAIEGGRPETITLKEKPSCDTGKKK
jgi:hypothetical protein